MKRSKFNLNNYRLHTGNMGRLLPIGCVPVLPGDTFQHSTSMLVRVSPLNTPVMHPTFVRIHHFFVPNRIIWDEWEDFITGGPEGTSTPQMPTVPISASDDLVQYLGCPNPDDAVGMEVNALPVRAFNAIFNEWYRDQDLVAERSIEDRSVPLIAWEKDYLTAARPWAQKGPDITLPITGTADVFHATGGGNEQVTVRGGDSPSDDWVRLLGTPNVTTGPHRS